MSFRVYVAGPMAGVPEFNYPKFHRAEGALERLGVEVVNPAAFQDEGVPEWLVGQVDFEESRVSSLARAAYLKRDFQELSKCDAIAMLDDWEDSTGANIELWFAHAIGLDVWTMEEFSEGLFEVGVAPRLRPMFGLMAAHITKVQDEKERTHE